nr:hypothetical protein BACY1_08680 [Tenacibaculum mesophilum]
MAFITTEDYTALIRNEIKAILLEDYSDTKLNAAEQMAISQVKNYLAGKYDIEAIFTATGEDRNKHIVMIVLDCTLYHLYTSVARKKCLIQEQIDIRMLSTGSKLKKVQQLLLRIYLELKTRMEKNYKG